MGMESVAGNDIDVTWVYVTRVLGLGHAGGEVMFLNETDAQRWVDEDPDWRRFRKTGVFNDYEGYLKINPKRASNEGR